MSQSNLVRSLTGKIALAVVSVPIALGLADITRSAYAQLPDEEGSRIVGNILMERLGPGGVYSGQGVIYDGKLLRFDGFAVQDETTVSIRYGAVGVDYGATDADEPQHRRLEKVAWDEGVFPPEETKYIRIASGIDSADVASQLNPRIDSLLVTTDVQAPQPNATWGAIKASYRSVRDAFR